MALARMAIHFYRPDFTEQHAKLLIQDYVTDLSDLDTCDVETAIRTYRQAPPQPGKPKYFPDSATLRQLAVAAAKDRILMSRPLKPLTDSRPIMWWLRPQESWKPNWRESDIPQDEMATFQKREKALCDQKPQTPRYVPGLHD